jgi:hypothetical protein
MASSDDIIDELMEKCKKHEDPTGECGFLEQLFRTTLCHDKKNGLPGHVTQLSEEERR